MQSVRRQQWKNGHIQFTNLLLKTKHIGIKYHHIRSKVINGTVNVAYVDTLEKKVDTHKNLRSRSV